MRQWGIFRPGRLRAGLALVGTLAVLGDAACSLVLETDTNPYKCSGNADCAHLPNAACDSARRICVPRLPNADPDAGTPPDTGAGGTGGLTCELTFDNDTRILAPGPDGGLRPLPEGP